MQCFPVWKRKMKKKKLRKPVLVLLVLALLAAALALTAVRISNARRLTALSAVPSPTPLPVSTPVPLKEYEFTEDRIQELRQELAEDEKINPDVQSILVFQSELVHDPVLQGSDNEHYLYVDWQTDEYRSYGSIMMDCINDLSKDEMNTIIYGHYIYEFRNKDRTLVFTPLAQFLDQENYQANRYLAMVTDHGIRYYEVADVWNCPMINVQGGQITPEEYQFNLVEYDEDRFSSYMEKVHEREYYSTGVEIEYGDRLLTLQTCIENQPDSREIVLCREIARRSF